MLPCHKAYLKVVFVGSQKGRLAPFVGTVFDMKFVEISSCFSVSSSVSLGIQLRPSNPKGHSETLRRTMTEEQMNQT